VRMFLCFADYECFPATQLARSQSEATVLRNSYIAIAESDDGDGRLYLELEPRAL